MSYYNDTEKIQALISDLKDSGYVKEGSVVDWHSSYIAWLKTTEANNAGYYGLELPWMEGLSLIDEHTKTTHLVQAKCLLYMEP